MRSCNNPAQNHNIKIYKKIICSNLTEINYLKSEIHFFLLCVILYNQLMWKDTFNYFLETESDKIGQTDEKEWVNLSWNVHTIVR